MISYLTLILSFSFNMHIDNGYEPMDSIPVKGRNYTGYIVELKDTEDSHVKPLNITVSQIARAEDSIDKFVSPFCRAQHNRYDSLDYKGYKVIRHYVRIYSGCVFIKTKERFIRIEAYEERYFKWMWKSNEMHSDTGNKLFIFYFNLDTGELIFAGDGGWGDL